VTIESRDASGAVDLTATVADGECTIGGSRVRLEDGAVVARSGGAVIGSVAAGPDAGRRDLTGADGARLLVVHQGEGRLDVLRPDGVPLVRATIDDRQARLFDAARAPLATITRDQGGLAVRDAEGTVVRTIAGTTDLWLGTLIFGPGFPPEARAVLVCERLLAPVVPESRR